MYSRVGVCVLEVVGLCGKGDAAVCAMCCSLAALSSGARRPLFSVIFGAWGCLFAISGVGLFGLLGVCFVIRIFVHEGLAVRED